MTKPGFTIKVIGTGSAFTKTQCHTSVLIGVDNKKYLLDCGFKVPQTLHDMGIKMADIDGIIISHVHADHTGGLEEFGFMGLYVLNKKFDLFLANDVVKELWDKTLAGGMEQLSDGIGKLDTFFNVNAFDDLKEFNINGLKVLPIKTKHVGDEKPSYSFVIDDRVFYSADMVFNRQLVETLNNENIEVFFHDCQLFTQENGVHASLEELSTLPEEIRRKIQALHYGDNYSDFEDKFKEYKITRVKQGDVYTF
ncbi:metal-dependent hydrolase [Bacillus phage G]|uniref:Gp388 n=1 Tax=Bacillus phage G TaxID=2884420 RepID=G3MAC9_9CAUD|nr:metal-dependent hydrolase [Bacillus phage G]AEO93647.1 gp388 [Bacillus phage G]